ncbi:MAG: DegT/DnrJ/EryC1/StrS aminotransferase family protein, partial [Candidatus Delongbacteria bacterium]|nr:DegT/DnrJ/EryC1/StrS aminotransferase family protein [Candidatus Delongbacteria bacterium]
MKLFLMMYIKRSLINMKLLEVRKKKNRRYTMNIQMVDMKKQYAQIKTEVEPKVLDILSSGWYIGGPEVKNFEEKAAEYTGVKHAIGCA